jgi:hypothetical protein
MTDNSSVRVRIGYEFLRNLGNFQNVKVKVEVEDSAREGESVADCRDRIQAFCEKSLIEQIVEIEDKLNVVE